MKLYIKYFAALVEHAGTTQEVIETDDSSILGLYTRLNEKYHFPYELNNIRVAVNQQYVEVDTVLKDGDEVVFVTPVAGG